MERRTSTIERDEALSEIRVTVWADGSAELRQDSDVIYMSVAQMNLLRFQFAPLYHGGALFYSDEQAGPDPSPLREARPALIEPC